jgi:large repetitive protein
MQSLMIPSENVTAVYSELEPCSLNFANCKGMLAREFPNAKISYSFEYGATPQSREAGVRQLQEALRKARLR